MAAKAKPARFWRMSYWYRDGALTSAQRRELRGIMDSERFCERIEAAACDYRAGSENWREAPTRAQVTASLDELDRNLSAVLYSIRSMDDTTRSLIELEWHKNTGALLEMPTSTELHRLQYLQAAVKVAKAANETRHHRPPDPWPRSLARTVAGILGEFGLQATATREGAFVRCLEIASGRGRESAFHLAREFCEGARTPQQTG